MLEYATENIDDIAFYVYEGIKVWNQINSLN